MKSVLIRERTHCPKGHDLRIHGYYFGSSQRCRECNRRSVAKQADLRRVLAARAKQVNAPRCAMDELPEA